MIFEWKFFKSFIKGKKEKESKPRVRFLKRYTFILKNVYHLLLLFSKAIKTNVT